MNGLALYDILFYVTGRYSFTPIKLYKTVLGGTSQDSVLRTYRLPKYSGDTSQPSALPNRHSWYVFKRIMWEFC